MLLPSSARPRASRAALIALIAIAAFLAQARDPKGAYAQPPPGEYIPDDEGPQELPPGANGDAYLDTDPSALTDFRSTLDPHGTWIDDPTYGQLWVPNVGEVGPSFSPYVTDGSWAYDDDYVWMSDFEWGWIPFHYGRWAWTGGRWGWVPGRVYAGAWVSWRIGAEGYGYVGWGPMTPTFGWRSGTPFLLGAPVVSQPGPVVFVARDALFAPQVAGQIVVGQRMATVAAETRPYGRVEAVPSERTVTQPVVRGPPPSILGVRASAIVRVEPNNLLLTRARAFARPSTAQMLGARLPVGNSARMRGAAGGSGGGGARVAPSREPAPRAGDGARGGGGTGRRTR
jgi:hypothetical protein